MNPITRVTVLTLVASALWLLQRKAKPSAAQATPPGLRSTRAAWWRTKPAPVADTGSWRPHSRQAYLMGKDGKPLALLPTERGPKAVADEIRRWATT